MAVFEIQGADGKTYEVDAPDAKSAANAFKKMMGAASPNGRRLPEGSQFVGTASDGGDIYRKSDGLLGYVGPVASFGGPEHQDRIKAMLEGVAAPDAIKSGMQSEVDKERLAQSPFASRVAKFLQGIPFAGEYTDELTGLLHGEQSGANQRAAQDAMARQNPVESAALQVVGAVAGSAPMIAVGGPAIAAKAPATLAGRAAAGAALGAAAGGAEGFVSGYGAGTGDGRMEAAVDRAKFGAIAGGAIGTAAPLVGAGIRNALEWARGKDVSVISRQLGVGSDAAKTIKAALENDDFVAAAAAMKSAGDDAMLADAGPSASGLLDTAMNQPGGAAARIGREAVDSRAKAAAAKLTGALDNILGPADGVKAATRDIAKRTAPAREAAYSRAYGSAIDYASDAGRDIEGVIARIPAGTFKTAINEANDAMKAAGVRNMQIMAEIADDGAVTFREMPNVQQLDELKKALQAIGRDATDPLTGKITGAGLRAKKLAGELSDAIGKAVGPYRTAVKLGGDKIAEQEALEMGRKLLSAGTTRESVAEMSAKPSVEARSAVMRGLRGYIDDAMANVQAAITGFDPSNPTAISEAVKTVKSFSSRANREKVEIAIGKARAGSLFKYLDEAATQLATRAAVARNSATASRLAGKEMVESVTKQGAGGVLLSGRPVEAAKMVIQVLTGRTDAAIASKKQAIYAEIARALTEKRGQQAQDALAVVQKAIAGQVVSSADAAKVARAFTAIAAPGAYRSGTQYLEARQGATEPR